MRYQVGFVPCRLDVWQCRKCKSASKWNLWCFHLIHLHNVYGVIHIKSALFEVMYKRLAACFPLPHIPSSDFMVPRLSPRSLSEQLYLLSFVPQEQCWHFYSLTCTQFDNIMQPCSFDLSHPHKKWRNPTLQMILDRYERESEREAGERFDRIRTYLGSITESALLGSVAWDGE